MKRDAPLLLEELEAWCEKQAHGMELARNLESLTKSFDSLLKVMDALYQVGGCLRAVLLVGCLCLCTGGACTRGHL